VILGRMRVRHPRVRTADGADELAVPTEQAFAATEPLDQLAVERTKRQALAGRAHCCLRGTASSHVADHGVGRKPGTSIGA
jgi:hypothetical protein